MLSEVKAREHIDLMIGYFMNPEFFDVSKFVRTMAFLDIVSTRKNEWTEDFRLHIRDLKISVAMLVEKHGDVIERELSTFQFETFSG